MDDAARLETLREALRGIKTKKLATQTMLEDRTGVDQTTISRVINGRRKRFSDNLLPLERYANMLLGMSSVPAAVERATKEFLVVGTESELIASIELARRLVAGRLR